MRSRLPGEDRAQAAKRVTAWNAAHRPGTAIAIRLVKDGPEYATRTRGDAWMMGDKAMVMVTGRSGGWDLTLIRPIRPGEALPKLPPKGTPPGDGRGGPAPMGAAA